MRKICLFLFLFLTFLPVRAQDFGQVRTEIREVVGSEKRFTKNLLLVIDQSGSMGRHDVQMALQAFKMISEQPIDEMELGVIVFAHGALRWKGVKEEDVAPGWARLPSAEATKLANKFIGAGHLSCGSTDFLAAMKLLESDTRKDPFDVIVISDGEFVDHETSDEILTESKDIASFYASHINRVIASRKKRQLPDFNLHFYGLSIRDDDKEMAVLSILAKTFKGTFVVERRTTR